jgi:uncharacterized protein YbaR (Trm112 family)
MPKLVKCQIANDRDMIIHCPGCFINLKDVPETTKSAEETVLLCPKCRRFFNEKGIIPY